MDIIYDVTKYGARFQSKTGRVYRKCSASGYLDMECEIFDSWEHNNMQEYIADDESNTGGKGISQTQRDDKVSL